MTDSTAGERALVDTDIVIYAYDTADAAKHQKAKALLEGLSDAGALVFSAQTFNEFASVMMKPQRPSPMSPDDVADILRRLEATAEVIPVSEAMTFLALAAMPRHGLSFWDALIWAAAKEAGVGVLYTEDFQHGRDVDGVRIVNPFLPATP